MESTMIQIIAIGMMFISTILSYLNCIGYLQSNNFYYVFMICLNTVIALTEVFIINNYITGLLFAVVVGLNISSYNSYLYRKTLEK